MFAASIGAIDAESEMPGIPRGVNAVIKINRRQALLRQVNLYACTESRGECVKPFERRVNNVSKTFRFRRGCFKPSVNLTLTFVSYLSTLTCPPTPGCVCVEDNQQLLTKRYSIYLNFGISNNRVEKNEKKKAIIRS